MMNVVKTIGIVIAGVGAFLWTGFSYNEGVKQGRKDAINDIRDVLFDDIVKRTFGDEDKEESKEVEPN